MIIGSHAHSHQILSKIKKSEQNKEITKSRKFLERLQNQKLIIFVTHSGENIHII